MAIVNQTKSRIRAAAGRYSNGAMHNTAERFVFGVSLELPSTKFRPDLRRRAGRYNTVLSIDTAIAVSFDEFWSISDTS